MLTLLALTSSVSGLLLLWFPAPFWWLGASLLAAGSVLFLGLQRPHWSVFWRWLHIPRQVGKRRFLLSDALLELLCFLAIAGLTLGMLQWTVLGHRPINYDHSVHYVKAWNLTHQFLSNGSLWGWSDAWFAGYPAQYLYPFGGDLWVAMFYKLGMGLWSFESAYALAFAAFWFLHSYALYILGRKVGGRGVGLAAALLMATDPGAYRMGGWTFAVHWGVWPQSLSLAFAMLALSQLREVLQERTFRHIAWFGSWLGIALLLHPMQILFFALLGPVAVVSSALFPGRHSWLVSSARLGVGYLLGIALASVWILPFLSTRQWATSYGALWWDTQTVGRGFYKLNLIGGTWSVWIALGVLGLLVMLFSRRLLTFVLGLVAFALLFVSSTDVLENFHLFSLSSAFENIQYQRFFLLFKPLMLLGAALVLGRSFGFLRQAVATNLEQKATESLPPLQRPYALFLKVFVVVFVLLPLVTPTLVVFGKRHFQKGLRFHKHISHRTSRQQFVRWAKQHFPKQKGYFRLALLFSRHDHSFLELGPQLGVKLYKAGFTPAAIFRYKPEKTSKALLRAHNVLYVLTERRLYQSWFELTKKFGRLRLYRFKEWNPQPFEILEGKGKVRLVKYTPERIELLASPGSSGRLRLNVSHFSRWAATLNGKPLEIQAKQIDNNVRTGMMTIPLKPGQIVFHFQKGWPERISVVFLSIALLCWLTLLWADARFFRGVAGKTVGRLQCGLEEWSVRHANLLRSISFSAGGLVFLGMLGLALWKPRTEMRSLHPTLKVKRVHADLVNRLGSAKVTLLRGRIERVCERRGRGFACGNASWQQVRVRQMPFKNKQKLRFRRCLFVHPQRYRTSILRFPKVHLGNALIGYFGIARTGKISYRAPVSMQLRLNGKVVWERKTPKDGVAEPFHWKVPEGLQGRTLELEVRAKAGLLT